MESEPMFTPREKSLSLYRRNISPEEYRTHDAASSRTANPTHYQWVIPYHRIFRNQDKSEPVPQNPRIFRNHSHLSRTWRQDISEPPSRRFHMIFWVSRRFQIRVYTLYTFYLLFIHNPNPNLNHKQYSCHLALLSPFYRILISV